jgi:hypothetical protein
MHPSGKSFLVHAAARAPAPLVHVRTTHGPSPLPRVERRCSFITPPPVAPRALFDSTPTTTSKYPPKNQALGNPNRHTKAAAHLSPPAEGGAQQHPPNDQYVPLVTPTEPREHSGHLACPHQRQQQRQQGDAGGQRTPSVTDVFVTPEPVTADNQKNTAATMNLGARAEDVAAAAGVSGRHAPVRTDPISLSLGSSRSDHTYETSHAASRWTRGAELGEVNTGSRFCGDGTLDSRPGPRPERAVADTHAQYTPAVVASDLTLSARAAAPLAEPHAHGVDVAGAPKDLNKALLKSPPVHLSCTCTYSCQ